MQSDSLKKRSDAPSPRDVFDVLRNEQPVNGGSGGNVSNVLFRKERPGGVRLVTSFNERLYHMYAKDNLAGWFEAFDPGIPFEIHIDGPFPSCLPSGRAGVSYRSLDLDEGVKSFKENFGEVQRPSAPPGQEFRFNFKPFMYKVFALLSAFEKAAENKDDFLVWLDADVSVRPRKAVSEDWLRNLIGSDSAAMLERPGGIFGVESGFLMFKPSDKRVVAYLSFLRSIYLTGALFDLAEWHDGFVFAFLNKVYKGSFSLRNLNASPSPKELHPFTTSPLHEFFEHKKGPLKFQ